MMTPIYPIIIGIVILGGIPCTKQVDKLNNYFDYFQKYMTSWTDYYET